MSETLSILLFIILSAAFYLSSLHLKFSCSGERFSNKKLYGAMLYNFIFIFIHMNHAKNGELPIIGKTNISSIEWVSFFMLFAYLFVLPSEQNRNQRNVKM